MMGCASDAARRAHRPSCRRSYTMEPVAYSVTDVLRMIGISRSKFYQLVNGGQIKVRKLGNRTIILPVDLNDFLQRLPTFGEKAGE